MRTKLSFTPAVSLLWSKSHSSEDAASDAHEQTRLNTFIHLHRDLSKHVSWLSKNYMNKVMYLAISTHNVCQVSIINKMYVLPFIRVRFLQTIKLMHKLSTFNSPSSNKTAAKVIILMPVVMNVMCYIPLGAGRQDHPIV